MDNNINKRSSIMGVRYKSEDVTRLKSKAEKVGLDVSTYVRYVSLNSLESE
ncbi:plasmid mobilization protein [Christiangramia sabulilitoris]|uniref:plasmid mobilization protein n=1 Tax=Christiangramia sabulilitoris TaxID=2583991 RepID=UPI003C2CFB27